MWPGGGTRGVWGKCRPVPEMGSAVPHKFLVIDDSPLVRTMLLDFAEELEQDADAFGTGKEGLDAVRTGDYDLVFLDMHLPDMAGLDVLRGIRHLKPDQRVVLITSDRGDDLFAAAHDPETTVSGFINKPFTLDQFETCIRTVLTLRGTFTHRKEGYHA